MNNFAEYLTPKQYKAIAIGDTRTLEEITQLAQTEGECEVCGQPVWKLGGTGMCFSCTTGESDASSDYELIAAGGKNERVQV